MSAPPVVNDALERVEIWLVRLATMLAPAAGKAPKIRQLPADSGAYDAGSLLWWRCSLETPPAALWIGADAASRKALADTGAESAAGDIDERYFRLLQASWEAPGTAAECSAAASDPQAFEIAIPERPPIILLLAWAERQEDTARDAATRPLAPVLLEIVLPLHVRLGRAAMTLGEICRLNTGSLLTFDSTAKEPVELLVNGRSIGRGELVQVQGNYGLRILEVAGGRERMEGMALAAPAPNSRKL